MYYHSPEQLITANYKIRNSRIKCVGRENFPTHSFEKIKNIGDAFLTAMCYDIIMRRIGLKTLNFILTFALVIALMGPAWGDGMYVYATTIQEKEEEIEEIEEIIEGLEDEVDSMIGEQELLFEQIDDINAEIINVMAEIDLLEDEIIAKEKAIATKQVEYQNAKEELKEQEEAMAQRIKLSYERGGAKYALMKILSSSSVAEFLNRTTYAEHLYDYDAKMLQQYEQAKQDVQDMWNQLEEEKTSLEANKTVLEEQKLYCDSLKLELQEKADNYEVLIAQAESKAQVARTQLKKEQQALAKLKEEEARRKALEDALNGDYDSDYNDLIDAATGSEVGKQMAKFGCQYIGNKYVYGGNSLTDGIDCSGFTYQIYRHFGYTIPRSSLSQRSIGKEVSLENAQPGDIVCYSGHVGLYIGGGYIVHASNSKPYPKGGIKVSKATYRTILSVRRVIE